MFRRIRWQRYSNFVKIGIIVLVSCYFVILHKYLKDFVHTLNNVMDIKILISKPLNESQIQHFERLIQADLDKQVVGLGNNGEPTILDGEAMVRGENDLKIIGLNKELSDHLTYNRTTPDSRNPLCRNIQYDRNYLQSASVIVIFHNEPYSLVLRTVHSVLRTTDQRNLKEIILVDDESTNDDLKDKLDYYMSTRFPVDTVKIVRLRNRSGLIRARLAGARAARGDVLVFLDAHCECVVNWLEPLLERIRESTTSVLLPIVDIIDSENFRFRYLSDDPKKILIGGFTWQAQFRWIDVPERELSRQQKECLKELEICPVYSPTMIGGIFAISRDYFWESGSYDNEMDGWGAENIEMSFRIWQCGGTIETIPCSRIGHVFRKFRPYSLPEDIQGINAARTAMVWMDEYKYMFFLERPKLKHSRNIGDVTQRRILRKNLQCKSFEWYMKNVYPEKFDPINNAVAYGRFSANSTNLCLDNLKKDSTKPYDLGVYLCIRPTVTLSQFFALTNSGVLRTELNCALVKINGAVPFQVIMDPCVNTEAQCDKWNYSESQIRHLNTNMCLDHEGLANRDHIVIKDCDPNKISQKWRIEP